MGFPDSAVTGYDLRNAAKHLLINCLDGGGVRGLSTLLILKAIFIEVALKDSGEHGPDHPKHDVLPDKTLIARPCYYLDHITGTSTGGSV